MIPAAGQVWRFARVNETFTLKSRYPPASHEALFPYRNDRWWTTEDTFVFDVRFADCIFIPSCEIAKQLKTRLQRIEEEMEK